MERKPDFEDERLRAWKMSMDDYDEIVGEREVLTIIFDENKSFQFFPSVVIQNEKTGKPIFAIKYKHEKKMILYLYYKENDEDILGISKFLNALKNIIKLTGMVYELVDVRELAKHTFNKAVKGALNKDG